MMNGTLKGRSAVVTGSTSGIGLGIARALAAAGANVMLNGLGEAREIETIRAEIEGLHDVKVRYSSADMSQAAQVRDMIGQAEAEFGAVDILVNNAGIQFVSPVESFPEEKWDAILAINLSSNFHSIRAALPGMRRRNWGRIINVASAHGLVASPFKSAYVAAKHGVVGLTKAVALEAAESSVTCNAICPAYVRTPLVEDQIRDQARAHGMSEEDVVREVMLAAQPNKRFVEIDELGELAVFLCSPAASSITGVALPVDGGWTAK
ncbi:MAG: 3-hydroxybutyrate dehydrogenase [Thauera phenolivorans]|uniref:3-hydroxybutyrate dehydrogenase n=1 Tax=Thauera phenolivorans TaxID=1792543 RepID=A0A7X7LWE4_9RHOO|nr:3-hydroxybutyrate dehydrogenase [Thauera phenolivorans]NLF54126.1 3-hydroxybutyrate dehydrogenase [Thauera phenolivorans]